MKFDQHDRLASSDCFAAAQENIVFSPFYIDLNKIGQNMVRFRELIEGDCLHLNAVFIQLSTDRPIPGTSICWKRQTSGSFRISKTPPSSSALRYLMLFTDIFLCNLEKLPEGSLETHHSSGRANTLRK